MGRISESGLVSRSGLMRSQTPLNVALSRMYDIQGSQSADVASTTCFLLIVIVIEIEIEIVCVIVCGSKENNF